MDQSSQAFRCSFAELIKFGEYLWFQISKIKCITQLGPSFANRSFCDSDELGKFPVTVSLESLSEI